MLGRRRPRRMLSATAPRARRLARRRRAVTAGGGGSGSELVAAGDARDAVAGEQHEVEERAPRRRISASIRRRRASWAGVRMRHGGRL